jgi:hypothetical protein
MDRTATEAAVKIYLREILNRLEMSTGFARAACVCAESSNVDGAVDIILDIEQPAYEASRLLDAASLLNRLSKPG